MRHPVHTGKKLKLGPFLFLKMLTYIMTFISRIALSFNGNFWKVILKGQIMALVKNHCLWILRVDLNILLFLTVWVKNLKK